jgi:hypothetical protein
MVPQWQDQKCGFSVTCLKQLWLLESNSFFAFSLWLIHVFIETLILFDENLLKSLRKVKSRVLKYECLGDS